MAESLCDRCGGSGYTLTRDGHWRAVQCMCVSSCWQCGGEGWVTVELPHPYVKGSTYMAQMRCPVCKSKAHRAKLINRADVPARYDLGKLVPWTAEQKTMLNWLDQWDKQHGFLLLGPHGVGKSQVMVTALWHLLQNEKAGRYIQQKELLTSLKRAFDGGDRERSSDLMERMCSVPVLAIDELDMPGSNWQRDTITEIFELRYQRDLMTLGTTNLPEESLGDVWGYAGPRIVSRMQEWMPVIQVGGPDLRDRKTVGGLHDDEKTLGRQRAETAGATEEADTTSTGQGGQIRLL